MCICSVRSTSRPLRALEVPKTVLLMHRVLQIIVEPSSRMVKSSSGFTRVEASSLEEQFCLLQAPLPPLTWDFATSSQLVQHVRGKRQNQSHSGAAKDGALAPPKSLARRAPCMALPTKLQAVQLVHMYPFCQHQSMPRQSSQYPVEPLR